MSETCQEAIIHIKIKLNEGHFEETSALMSDVVDGFYHMEQALANLPEQFDVSGLEQAAQRVQRSLELVVSAYEDGQPGQVLEKLQFSLQPAFHGLHRELDTVLRPSILS